ncbi:hypothetical protein [Campylobacter concisus]|uniref:hypothetical protein n=1 Tax=Campylobacter concisus TaxID=199 RepID=UPI001CA57411|nr:hypothetical protein [Campylobacter concisus]
MAQLTPRSAENIIERIISKNEPMMASLMPPLSPQFKPCGFLVRKSKFICEMPFAKMK